jgi:general transcription factor 3C polypeptide 3 (transcription factor C subunit 4)
MITPDDETTTRAWMDAAKDLVDAFRSFKDFYPWDQYLNFLGYSSLFEEREVKVYSHKRADLEAMAERLKQSPPRVSFP